MGALTGLGTEYNPLQVYSTLTYSDDSSYNDRAQLPWILHTCFELVPALASTVSGLI